MTYKVLTDGTNNTDYTVELTSIDATAIKGGKLTISEMATEAVTTNGQTYKVTGIASNALNEVKLSDVTTPAALCGDLDTALKNSKNTSSVKLTIVGSSSDAAVPNKAFVLNYKISEVSFQGEVEIGDYAFQSCANLTNVDLSNVQKIGQQAFQECGIRNLVIPGQIKKIPYEAFWKCKNLTTLTLEEGVEIIEGHAFETCKKLSQIYLPETLKTIGANAFLAHAVSYTVYYAGDNTQWQTLESNSSPVAWVLTSLGDQTWPTPQPWTTT